MRTLTDLNIKIFGDGADRDGMLELYRNPLIKGFTTNPTLMRKSGITNYRGFAKDILQAIPDRPISFEVFADDFSEMERQAMEIASWGSNVFVKIPITNTRGESSSKTIQRLSQRGLRLNVTAIMTVDQVRCAIPRLAGTPASYISIFAGRIADTGRDPVPIIAEALDLMKSHPELELIWASPRELLNLFQADQVGCHIITVSFDILKKLPLVGKSLEDFSLETVIMFFQDGQHAGFSL